MKEESEKAALKLNIQKTKIMASGPITSRQTEEETRTKDPLIKVKEESEKVDLKLNIHKTKIMASGPITSWQIDGQKMETVTDFIFLGSEITVDGDCSHEIKRRLLLSFPGGSHGKASVYNVVDPGSIPALGRFPGEGNGNPLSTLAWKIPWTEEPGRLRPMGSQRVGHN